MRRSTARVGAVALLIAGVAVGLSLVPQQAVQAQGSTYTICSDIPWAPFEMTNDSGDAFGFDLDVMRSIAVIEGYQIQIENLSFQSIIPAIQSGKCDIGASGFTITADRARLIDFSNAYYLSNQAIVIRSDGETNMIKALAGLGPTGAVGAKTGTTGSAWVQNNLVDNGVNVELKLYDTYSLAILDLINGGIDAVIEDDPASNADVSAYPDKLVVAGIINTHEYFGFPVKQGDPAGLLAKINDGMSKLGLNDISSAAGTELQILPDTVWDNLTTAYFGPTNDQITAAWGQCKGGILNAKTMDDLTAYAKCMARAIGS